jgi:hypothetical protein
MMANQILCIVLSFFCSLAWADNNQVTVTTDSQYRYIKSNGIPNEHGQFPNQGNPNSIKAQNYNFRMPLKPVIASKDTQLWGGMAFGVGLDGVPFDPGTAEFWNNDRNWRYEALSGKINLGMDQNNAHVQPNGAYHYHGLPTDLTHGLSSNNHSAIIGYAADGFPIYALYGYAQANNPASVIKELQSSYKLRSGTRISGPGGTYDGTYTADYEYVPGAGDLDECNGRVGVTPDYPTGTYAYFISDTFPLIPRCFKGTPDQSFVKQGGGPMGARPPQQNGGGARLPPPYGNR